MRITNIGSFGKAALVILALFTLSLAGCGGSGGLSSQVVSGVAAVGDSLSGEVSLKDDSSPAKVKTAIIGSDGSFAFDVTGMKAPFILQANGSAGGTMYKLHSFSESVGTANINPLTDAIVAGAAEVDDPEEAYRHDDSERRKKIRSNLSKTVEVLLAKLQPLLKQYNAEHTNPITSRYIVNHLDLDDMFDKLKIAVQNGILTITSKKTGAVIFTGKVTDIANGTLDTGAIPPPPAVPSAPTGMSASGGAGQVTVTWTSVGNATSYNVYYSTTSGVTTANGTKVPGATPPHALSGLVAGTRYYVIATAVNSAGESTPSAEVSTTTSPAPPTPTPPLAPTGVTATGGDKQVTVAWPAVSGATSYNLYWSTTSGAGVGGTKITGATSPAVQTGLDNSATYYYVVTAVNGAGESAPSVQIAATTITPAPTPVPPATPSGVTAAGGANRTTVSWPAISGATSYNLYWSTTSGAGTSGTKLAGVTSPYVHTGLSAGTTYYYVVTAVNAAGESAASVQTSTATNPAPPALPAAPAGVTATGGASQMTVSWSAVTGATSYNLYWSTSSGVTTATGTKITGAASPYNQTGLAAGTTYFYVVTAVNAAGESPASNQASGATNAPAPVLPAAPSGVTATGGASQVTLSWSPVSGATSYNMYWSATSGVTKTSGARIVNATSPYVQTGLAAGTAYYFIVTAVNSAGESAASAQATATTNAPTLVCGTCHAIPPAVGRHSRHTFTSCGTCHGAGYSSTTVNAATHDDGVKNVGGTSGWNAATRSCSNSCHGSRAW